MARDEDDWHVDSLGRDALLQLKPVEIRKADVEDEAARYPSSRAVEEFPR